MLGSFVPIELLTTRAATALAGGGVIVGASWPATAS